MLTVYLWKDGEWYYSIPVYKNEEFLVVNGSTTLKELDDFLGTQRAQRFLDEYLRENV